jgi:hypothetical protein
MATVLDLGLLQYFDVIFVALAVWCIVFAILQKTEALGKAMGINAIIAAAAAFMILLSETLVSVISFMIPWFVVVIIFFVLMLLIFQTFDKNINLAAAIADKTVYWAIIGISLIILLAAIGNVAGQGLTEAAFSDGDNVTTVSTSGGVASTSFSGSLMSTLFHPKVLGLIILFGIAIFAIAFLSGG